MSSCETTAENSFRNGALVRRIRPSPSTEAIAIGVLLKKRVKRMAAIDADWSLSSSLERASTIVRLSPGAPSRVEETR